MNALAGVCQWWAEVMGWAGTWQLAGLALSVCLFGWALWALGRWEGRMVERRRWAWRVRGRWEGRMVERRRRAWRVRQILRRMK